MYEQETLNAIAYNNALMQANAERQMEFQDYTRHTSHQVEVEDLKKAGLNPVLSAGGSGATGMQGAMAGVDTSASAYYINKMNNATSRYVSDNSLAGALANAGAMVQAAQLNSAAAMYGAYMSNEAMHYSADQNYAGTVYNTDYNRNGTPWGVGSAYFNKWATGSWGGQNYTPGQYGYSSAK